jgi:uncharacterized membrane protein YgcG
MMTMKIIKKSLITVILLLLCPLYTYADQLERIIEFKSLIIIHDDSTIRVTETIKVRCENIKINRGIYRDFPTDYTGTFGTRRTVGFRVINILRDGKPEPYHITDESNGKRIYIGKEDVYLQRGEYTYSIVYETDRQLGYFEDHDELYWNVTGNGWEFAIDTASAVVVLPAKIPREEISMKAYTGPQGSRDSNCRSYIDSNKKVNFTTTKTLNSYEGLTILVSWPKGFVKAPDERAQFHFFINDNWDIILGLLGVILLLLYYIIVWLIAGRDPARGTIIPLYNPPENLSPAAMRFIKRMGYDIKAFTAAIINMAVKDYLTIKDDNNEYTLHRGKADLNILTAEEKKIAKKLLGNKKKIVLKNKNHTEIRNAINSIKKTLNMNYEKVYFVTNRGYFIPGIITSIVIIVLTFFFSRTSGEIYFIGIWLAGWTIGVLVLLSRVIETWKSFFTGRDSRILFLILAIFLTIFSIPFIGAEVFVLIFFVEISTFWLITIIVVLLLMNYIFYRLLKAPTRAGRKLLDKIEGFKIFLSIAEKDRLRFAAPLEKTPEIFEKYLPYALALDVEQEWAEQFSEVISNATIEGTQYTPSWYHGTSYSSTNLADFSKSLGGSFSSAISSSSSAPGSSSGGGGGGAAAAAGKISLFKLFIPSLSHELMTNSPCLFQELLIISCRTQVAVGVDNPSHLMHTQANSGHSGQPADRAVILIRVRGTLRDYHGKGLARRYGRIITTILAVYIQGIYPIHKKLHLP